jgi:hypothetical protein
MKPHSPGNASPSIMEYNPYDMAKEITKSLDAVKFCPICNIKVACGCLLFTDTNRIEGRITATQMAAASAASFLCLLSRVEERRGGAFVCAPFPLPAHQTGRAVFPHPAFRPASLQGTRRRHLTHAVQHEHAGFPMNLMGEPSDASAWRIVSSAKKSDHTVEDMSINGLA